MCSMKKEKSSHSAHSSSNSTSAFPWQNHSTSVGALKWFIHTTHLVTWNIKKTYTQGLRINKINVFYCFTEDILKWNWLFFSPFNCKFMAVKNIMTSSALGRCWPGFHAKAPAAFPKFTFEPLVQVSTQQKQANTHTNNILWLQLK